LQVYAVADGYAWSGGTENSSSASSTADYLRVGVRTASGDYRTLIKFDLSSIPTVDWNEGYLSWSKAENYNSFSYDAVTDIAGSGAGYKAWDVTSLVQNWVDGTYNNYGVLLRAPTQSGSSIYRGFRSKEYGSNIPKLEVTYIQNPNQPPDPPTLVSPQGGAIDVSLTPTFKWNSVADADYYGLYISKPPLRSNQFGL
jgi:hypothetical protein